MNVLVVFCHPTHQSFTGATLQRVLAGLSTAGHETRVVDLYAMGFRPEMSFDERGRHSVDHRLQPGLRSDIAEHIGQLQWAQALVMVYPTWWAGQPAMLKGWFDRVLVNGVAWSLPHGGDRIRPMLTNIRRLVVVTSHGSTKWVNMVEGEGGKRVVGRAIRVLCSRRCRTRWVSLYNIDRASSAERQAFLDRVEHCLACL
ncbi:MAG: putative oxidoreductase [Ilumatobacteraceae bacterium]|nr:putative oxidoreductase [Ilumatobacteraceae bacterium]